MLHGFNMDWMRAIKMNINNFKKETKLNISLYLVSISCIYSYMEG